MGKQPDLIITGAKVYTADPRAPWAEALAVTDGVFTAVGSEANVRAMADAATTVVDVAGQLVLPGLIDEHIHLGLGGGQAAWELSILPSDTNAEVLAKVAEWARGLEPDAWIVGGIISSQVLDEVANTTDLAALDAAAGGRPVLLRDLSMHNRWVSSRTLELMGVTQDTVDPSDGEYVRDAAGNLTGVLYEIACAGAETAFQHSIADPSSRNRTSLKTSLDIINSFGITAVQDGATMGYAWEALGSIEEDGELTAWVIGSMPTRPFLEDGVVGEELYAIGAAHRTRHLRPDFLKFVLDGVPITRTSAMLNPYVCHAGDDPEERGETYWTLPDLIAGIEYCYDNGFNAKLHGTGNASAKLVLDAIEDVQSRRGPGPLFQLAHPEFIDPADVPRFAVLGVVPDAAPYLWYPGPITDAIKSHVDDDLVEKSWAFRDLLDAGAIVAAGSDWPCVLTTPDPWIGLETLVTRANVDPSVGGVLGASQRLSVEEAVAAFTRDAAKATGLDDVTGMIREGLSADFIVLDQNIFEIDPSHIHKTRVDATYFDGSVVYRRVEVS